MEARPPTAGYRLRKLVRRHKGQAMAASLVLVALLAGVAGTSIRLVRADAARREAEGRRAEAVAARAGEADQRAAAEAGQAEAEAVVQFFEVKVFAAARPKGQDGGLGHDVTLRAAVSAALPAVADEFKHQPLVEARLRFALGKTFIHLGDAEAARPQFEQARVLYSTWHGPEHSHTLASAIGLAVSYSDLGRHAAP